MAINQSRNGAVCHAGLTLLTCSRVRPRLYRRASGAYAVVLLILLTDRDGSLATYK
jgi:hypothetical protein